MPPKTPGSRPAGKSAGKAAGAKARSPAAAAAAKRVSERATKTPVRLGTLAANGVAPALFALVERGVAKRPEVARDLRATVEVYFKEPFAPLRMEFDESEIRVADVVVEPPPPGERAEPRRKGSGNDLVITGSLPDIVHLASTPLIGGIPRISKARGREAIAKVAGGRVKIEGNPLVARRVLKLLEL